jgi:hypothetical protein
MCSEPAEIRIDHYSDCWTDRLASAQKPPPAGGAAVLSIPGADGSPLRPPTPYGPKAVSENDLFESFICLKMIFLPRQARDKYGESTQKQTIVFLQAQASFLTQVLDLRVATQAAEAGGVDVGNKSGTAMAADDDGDYSSTDEEPGDDDDDDDDASPRGIPMLGGSKQKRRRKAARAKDRALQMKALTNRVRWAFIGSFMRPPTITTISQPAPLDPQLLLVLLLLCPLRSLLLCSALLYSTLLSVEMP